MSSRPARSTAGHVNYLALHGHDVEAVTPAGNTRTSQPTSRRVTTTVHRVHGGSSGGGAATNGVKPPPCKWDAYLRRVRSVLSKVRYEQSFIESYENVGWKPGGGVAGMVGGSRGHARAQPILDLMKAKLRVVQCHRQLRSLLAEIDAESASHTKFNMFGPGKGPSTSRAETQRAAAALAVARAAAGITTTGAGAGGGGAPVGDVPAAPGDDDGVDAEDIACSRCGGFDSVDDDDILCCDYRGCGLAYHMSCCDPPVTTPPPEDADWVCPRCSCLIMALSDINDECDTHFDRFDDVFVDVEAEAEALQVEERALAAAEAVRRARLTGAKRQRPGKGGGGSRRDEVSTSDSLLAHPTDSGLEVSGGGNTKRPRRDADGVHGDGVEDGAEGVDGTGSDGSDDGSPRRPMRACAAAARVRIEHELRKLEAAAASKGGGNAGMLQPASTAGVVGGGVGDGDSESMDEDFASAGSGVEGDSDDTAHSSDTDSTGGSGVVTEEEVDSGDDLEALLQLAPMSPLSTSDDGGEGGGGRGSRRLKRKAPVDYVALNAIMFGSKARGTATSPGTPDEGSGLDEGGAPTDASWDHDSMLDDDTEWRLGASPKGRGRGGGRGGGGGAGRQGRRQGQVTAGSDGGGSDRVT